MASPDEVKKLAALARISIPERELPTMAKEFDSILAYIGQIETMQIDMSVVPEPTQRNVFREDGVPHEGGKYTEKLVAQFPARDGDYLQVKKIISHD